MCCRRTIGFLETTIVILPPHLHEPRPLLSSSAFFREGTAASCPHAKPPGAAPTCLIPLDVAHQPHPLGLQTHLPGPLRTRLSEHFQTG